MKICKPLEKKKETKKKVPANHGYCRLKKLDLYILDIPVYTTKGYSYNTYEYFVYSKHEYNQGSFRFNLEELDNRLVEYHINAKGEAVIKRVYDVYAGQTI